MKNKNLVSITDFTKEEYLKILEREMAEAAESLDFEKAALLRDQIFELKAGMKR